MVCAIGKPRRLSLCPDTPAAPRILAEENDYAESDVGWCNL